MIVALFAAAAVAQAPGFVMSRFDREEMTAFDGSFETEGLSGKRTLLVSSNPDAKDGPIVFVEHLEFDCIAWKWRAQGGMLIGVGKKPAQMDTVDPWQGIEPNTMADEIINMACEGTPAPSTWIQTSFHDPGHVVGAYYEKMLGRPMPAWTGFEGE